MYGAVIEDQPAFGNLIAVLSVEAFQYLVKSKMATDKAVGRDFFVVLGGEKRCYHVRAVNSGFEVDAVGVCSGKFFLAPGEITSHPIGRAIAEERLFTSIQ